MNKRRVFSSLMLLFMITTFMGIFVGCYTSKKVPIPQVQKNVYIYDEAKVIDTDITKRLNQMLIELEEKTEVEFAIISIESLLDISVENYANNLFNTLGIGKKGKDNGILLLFSPSDVKVRLEIGRGLEGCLNDAKCGRILDKYFVPYRESNEYSKATSYTMQAVLKVLCEEYNITIDGLDMEAIELEEPDELIKIQKILLIIVAIVFLILLEWITGSFFGDGFGDGLVFLVLSLLNSSSSSGGFGGGFSGGGGASR